jgi:hypothetical protein
MSGKSSKPFRVQIEQKGELKSKGRVNSLFLFLSYDIHLLLPSDIETPDFQTSDSSQ